MSFVNVGARYTANGESVQTKAMLKRMVAEDPKTITLYGTSDFNPGTWKCDELDEGVNYTVAGPDPYNKRDWYATVKRKGNTVKVS